MEEELPPPPPSPDVGSTTVDVTLKRKTVHTNVTVVESATRFWLSAQVMIACILLGLLALSIQSSRSSISYFPATFNTSCTDSTYTVKSSIEYALQVLLDEAVNITNTQYQTSVSIARNIVSRSMNTSVDIFLLLMKQVNPVIYCTIDSGLAIAGSAKQQLRNIQVPSVSCNINKRDASPHISYNSSKSIKNVDPCLMATNALQDVLDDITNVIDDWPSIPTSLADAFNEVLTVAGFIQYIEELANFPSPTVALTINSSEIIRKAMANASAFNDIAVTCTSVSIKFEQATQRTANVMYYIEIAIWVAIVVLLVGIFLVAIVRQFPSVFVEWVTAKITYFTNKWDSSIDNLEKNSVRTWQLYLLWTLKYINFKKAVLTTAYGIIGIILVLNLTNITNAVQQPIEVWIDQSLGPAFDNIQAKLQDGINQVTNDVEMQLNNILRDEILDSLVPINGTLNQILTEKDVIVSKFKSTLKQIQNVSVVGPGIANGLQCMLPTAAFTILDGTIDMVISFLQEIIVAQVYFPKFSFPNVSRVAVSSTHIVVSHSVQIIQDELQKYMIIFILLSAAFGILVLQGLLFVALRRIAIRIKKQRRLTRL